MAEPQTPHHQARDLAETVVARWYNTIEVGLLSKNLERLVPLVAGALKRALDAERIRQLARRQATPEVTESD